MKNRLALVCAVAEEARGVVAGLKGIRPADLGPGRFILGNCSGVDVALCVAGVGKVNAAQALTLLLEHVSVWGVISFGIGGAYPGTGLTPGDAAVATTEILGDEGVETATGFRDIDALGLPEDARVKSAYPADPRMMDLLYSAARQGARGFAKGPFVTVSLCTGTDKRASWMRRRFAGVCENMEGAAVAQVAGSYGIPFAEIRGVSNMAGRRDRREWQIPLAVENVGEVVRRALSTLGAAGF